MKIILTFLLGGGFAICNAQTSVNASGGNVSAANGSASYSIGQVFQETVTSGSYSIAQGVQQPYEFSILGVDNYSAINLEMKVYPNPTTSTIFLKTGDEKLKNLSYHLYDATGRIVSSAKISKGETEINLSQNPSGVYVLVVSDESTKLKTFKIIKK